MRAGSSVTVVFDLAGGSAGFPTRRTVTTGQRCPRPTPDPTRAGYLFDGWFTGNTPLAHDFNQPVTDGITLTAHWSPASIDTQWSMTPDHGTTRGNDTVTLTPPPPRGIRFTQVSAGDGHSLGIGSDGNLYSWGANGDGQLGRTTDIVPDSVPGLVAKPAGAPAGFTWTQASAGNSHVMAVGSDGNLYTWGSNRYGQLGRTTPSTSPNPTPGLVAKPTGAPAGFTWTQATAGYSHSMALGSDGNLYTWGDNSFGQLGRTTPTIGTSNPDPTPGLVAKPAGAPAGFTWTQAIAGVYHSMAFGSDGNLYTWGNNDAGQLGRTTSNYLNPTPGLVDKPAGAPAGFTWTQATAGHNHSMAIGSDGNLYTWGRNQYGQLGRTTTDIGTSNSKNPTPGLVDKPTGAPAGFTWTQAIAGHNHSMAIGSDGNLYTWGRNQYGQLGRTTNNGTNIYSPTPGPVDKPTGAPAGFTWTQATAGDMHSMAIGSDGNLYTWGWNNGSYLGRPTNNSNDPKPGLADFPFSVPTRVVFDRKTSWAFRNTDGTWKVSTPSHVAGLVDTVITWTRNGVPQADMHLPYTYKTPIWTLTFDADGGSPTPPAQQVSDEQPATRPADPVKAGYEFDGWFYGYSSSYRSNVAYDFTQPVTWDLPLKARWSPATPWSIDRHVGSDAGGDQVTLTPPTSTRGVRFGQVSAGGEHSMAIGSDGNLYTWGSNRYGQLGRDTGSSGNDPKPGAVPKPAGAPAGFTWTQASAGDQHSMAIGSDGNLYTWGRNLDGQLGRTANNGTDTATTNPGTVNKPTGTPAGFTWTRISAGGGHSLAIGSDGNLYAWGRNRYGQLGRADNTGTSTPNPTPGIVPKPAGAPTGFYWLQISAGGDHSLAIGYDDRLYTWGSNQYGQLGRPDNSGTTNPNPTPGTVDRPADAPSYYGDRDWTRISAGGSHTIAYADPSCVHNNTCRTSTGDVYTWGLNRYGQLGRDVNTGTWNPNPTPGAVAKPNPDIEWLEVSAGTNHSTATTVSSSSIDLYSWGSNGYGQLGRATGNGGNDYTPTPGIVAPPAGASTSLWDWESQVPGGGGHTMGVGEDGNLYAWGDNRAGQLGRDTPAGSNPYDLGTVPLSGPATPTGVRFGTKPGTGLTANTDGTWRVTTPEHDPGTVTVTIDWTRDGGVQTPDTGNRYEFQHIGVLPRAGGEGILPLLLMGLLAMATALAGRRHRQDTTTPTSPE